MTGARVSTTVMTTVAVIVWLLASLAVKVTVVGPSGNFAGAFDVTISGALSASTAFAARSIAVTPPSTVWSTGTCVKCGGVISLAVTLTSSVTVLPDGSRAVSVTGVTLPTARICPTATDCVTTTGVTPVGAPIIEASDTANPGRAAKMLPIAPGLTLTAVGPVSTGLTVSRTSTLTFAVRVLPATSLTTKDCGVAVRLNGKLARTPAGTTPATPEPVLPLVSSGSVASASMAAAVPAGGGVPA